MAKMDSLIKVSLTSAPTTNIDRQLEVHLKAEAGRIAYNTARRVQALAKAKVPVDTGKLKESIHREKVGPAHHVVVADAENDYDDPYGRYVEFGTRLHRAQPFLGPAVVAARKGFKKDLKTIFKTFKVRP